MTIKDFEEGILAVTKFPKLEYDLYTSIQDQKKSNNLDTCDILSLTKSLHTIEFSFDNVQYTENFTYIEFDIMAEVNTPGLKFGKGTLFIDYAQAFGDSLIADSTVEITKGTILQAPMYSFVTSDHTDQIMRIDIDGGVGSNALYTFTGSPESILHFKLKIEDFSQIGTISFPDIDISGLVYYWCQGQYSLFDDALLDKPIVAVNPEEGAGTSLTYTFENMMAIDNDSKVQFDIFASADASTLFSEGYVYVSYNDLAIPINQVANGTLQLTRGDIIGDNTTYEVEVSDYNGNGFLIHSTPFFDADPNNLFNLGSTSEKYATIVLSVSDCNQSADLVFDEFMMNDDKNTHYTGDIPFPFEYYDPVIASDEETGTICGCSKPVISSFSPSVVHAGTGEILTITGSNFGTWDENLCTVLFPNADDGGFTMMEAGAQDFQWDNIVHWTDTEIQIKVPSTDKFIGAEKPAMTGKFKVKNACEESEESSSSLQIPYSILNSRDGSFAFSKAKKMTLKETDNDGICFQFTDDMPGWMVAQFQAALSSWCSETNINFLFGGVVDESTPTAVDGINVVKYGGTSVNVGGSMSINGVYYNDLCNNTEEGWVFKEIDFTLFGRDVINPTNDELNDLLEISRHELGHSHMLAHSENGAIMFYTGNQNGFITNNDSDGANLVFGNSQAIAANCGTPIGSGACGQSCSTNSTFEGKSSGIVVSPNPTSDVIAVEFDNHSRKRHLQLLDSSGRLVKEEKVSDGGEKLFLKMPQETGMYILKVLMSDGTHSYHKITKI